MVVGVVQFRLFMPHNHSLKEKRKILNRLKDRVLSDFQVFISEVGDPDLWQNAVLGFALVGNDEAVLDSLITRTMNFIVAMHLGEVSPEERDFIRYDS